MVTRDPLPHQAREFGYKVHYRITKTCNVYNWHGEYITEPSEPLWKENWIFFLPFKCVRWNKKQPPLILFPTLCCWVVMQRGKQEYTVHTEKKNATQFRHSTRLSCCVLMTYVQFTSKWQRQHQTQPIKPNQREVQLSLSWNHRKGKDKYVPSVFQKEERAACCLTEHFLFWKCSTWRRDGNMNHRGWKSNRNTEGVKSMDKEATKNREQHLYIYGHACKPTLMAWHFRRSSVWKFPYLSPVVQWKKKLHHIP